MSVEPRQHPGLLEREDELSEATALLDAVASGTGAVALVQGPAGIGKTSLLRALRVGAAERGLRVLTATGSELERDFTFGVVQQLFGGVLHEASPDERAALLSGAAAGAEAVFDVTAEPSPSHAILHGLHWLCAGLADGGPLLLVVDDGHWADDPSLTFLEFLARRIEDLPVLLAVAERPTEAGGALAALAAMADTHVLAPPPLSAAAIAALLAAELQGEPDPAFVDACAHATGGNPLLVAALGREMALRGSTGSAAEAEEVRSAVPGSLVRNVVERLRRQGPHALEVAQGLAVLGERARPDRLARLTGVAVGDVEAALDALVRAELLSAEPLGFTHPLVREAVATDVVATTRSRLHRTAADLLRADGARDEIVALHLLESGPAGDHGAARVLRRAGERAVAEGAPALAARLLDRALAEPPAPEDRASLLGALGAAEMATGQIELAMTHLGEAVAAGDAVVVARAELSRATMLHQTGRHAESAAGLGAALERLGDAHPQLEVRLVEQLVEAQLFVPELVGLRAERLARLDVETAPAALLSHLAIEQAMQLEPKAQVVATARRAYATGELLEDFHWGRGSPYWVAEALCAVEAADEAFEFLRQAAQAAGRSGSPFAVAYVAVCQAHADWRFGDLRRAEEEARFALETFRATGLASIVEFCAACLGQVLLDRGDLPGAAAHLGAPGGPSPVARLGSIEAMRARLLLAQGRPEEAVIEVERQWQLEEGARWSMTSREHSRATMVAALGAAGQPERALEVSVLALQRARSRDLGGAVAAILLSRATLERGDEALATLAEAAEVAQAAPLLHVRARALVEHGAALRRAGQRTAARDQLMLARELAHRIGADGVERLAFDELQVAGARPRRIALTGKAALTAAELRAAEHAAQGLSNREIAETLFVTRKTVELHLGRAYAKLGIRSRAELGDALAPVS